MAKFFSKFFDFFHPMIHTARFVIGIIIAGAIIFAVLGIGAIQIWEYSNSNAFCATVCHQVHPEEPAAYADSQHGQVKCTECHMGRLGTLTSMRLKASHAKHLPATIFKNYHRPTHAESLGPSKDSCELCHSPLATHSDTLRVFKRYLPDENNTEQRTVMTLKLDGGNPANIHESGIHWHIMNTVEFFSPDESKQEIPWVRLTRADGSVIEFTDSRSPLSSSEIDEDEIHIMDCIDCHNREGHPFISPDKAVDDALADGRLSRDLPFIKAEMFSLLASDYENQPAAIEAAEAFADSYAAKYPDAARANSADLERAGELAGELILRTVFEDPGISWKTFPDNQQHKDFPGCFRCHDGNHVSSGGDRIPLNCTTCHSTPTRTTGEAALPSLSLQFSYKPPSHDDDSFFINHRILANDQCTGCHGELAYGKDDSSYCASSACHDSNWPNVDYELEMDAHPFPLTGNHEGVACYSCHQGELSPKSDCTSCHSGPKTHFTESCDSCHSPEGWKQSAASLVSASTKIPHPAQGMGTCTMCHDPSEQSKPAGHNRYRADQCLICHREAS